MAVAAPSATDILARVSAYAEDVLAGHIVAGRLTRLACERHRRDVATGGLRGLWFDDDAAERAILFIEQLPHSKGEFAGQKLRLEPWQVFIVGSVFGWKRADGTRRFRRAHTEVARKNGKALWVETLLPTPTGFVRMGDVKVGDTLFDERGMPCTVTFATDVMHGHACYRVRFSDGAWIIADADHLWQTRTRRHANGVKGRKRRPDDEVWTTRQIAATLTVDRPYNREHGRVEWNHSIPVADPLQCETADLPVDPYLLGAWLGDGHTAAALITTVDAEIVQAIEAVGVPVRQRGDSITWALGDGDRTAPRGTSVQARLRALGVLGYKHIPMPYQRASISQRMSLLRGIMDTDGHVTNAGQCEYVTVNRQLAGDVQMLLHGLGFKPTLTTDRATIDGRDCGERFRIQFCAYDDRPVFALTRKRVRQKPAPNRPTRSTRRQIVAVDPEPTAPVRCIQVDSPSHLFLAGTEMIPTHNTTLLAAVGLYLAFADGEPGAEVYSAATKRDQAKILWSEADRMVAQTPALARRVTRTPSKSNLAMPSTASTFEPLGRDADTSDGLNPHAALIDELHAHPNRDLVDVLDTALGARRQPLRWNITTAGFNQQSIWWEEREYAVRVLEGVIEDDSLFAVIYTLDAGDDWRDEAVWPKANPNLGVSVKLDALREEAHKAALTPGLQNPFRCKRLNQPTEQSERWIDLAQWDACADAPRVEPGMACFVGIDLSSTIDLTAAVALFPAEDGAVGVLARFWRPEEGVLAAEKRDGVPYRQWARDGYLTLTEGSMIDPASIAADVLDWTAGWEAREFPFDAWNAASAAAKLEQAGAVCVAMAQGYATYTEPCHHLEALLATGKLRHGGQPVLRWMAGQVEVKHGPNNAIRPWKPHGSGLRNDGIVALLMALNRLLVHQRVAATGPTFWDFDEAAS